jgi:hypothetical protein
MCRSPRPFADEIVSVREKKADLEKLEAHLSDALNNCNQALKQQPKSPEACPALRQMADSRSQSGEMKMNSASCVVARGR